MTDLNVLKAHGLTQENLKKWLEDAHLPPGMAGDKKKPNYKTWLLIKQMQARVQAGLDFNSIHYSLFYALDLAFDAPFQQISPTLLTTLADKSPDEKDVADQLKSWGIDLNEVLYEVPDPKTPGKNIRKVSVPAFFQIYVPLVASYVKIRWSKIMNDRKLIPTFSYAPKFSNELGRMRCEVITSRVESMSSQYGYYETLKQWVFMMLHYGNTLMFPVEEWHQECQLFKKSDKNFKGDIEGDYKKVVVKEGFRYHLPHPSRFYFDRAWPASSLNTDTGCNYAGYWRIKKWGDIRRNKNWWNLDRVAYGNTGDWGTKYRAYFTNAFRGSTIRFPSGVTGNLGVGKNDTEKALDTQFYSDKDDDATILVTEHFEKIVPKEWGLGTYEYPVWFRFVLAGDCAVLYAAPIPYSPALFMGYDHVDNRTHNASMSLEILPFQDQFGNLLTQVLLTCRQNLANLTMVDTDIVEEKNIKEIENWGERFWRKLNIMRFSGNKLRRAQKTKEEAIIGHKFPQGDINGFMASMRVILDTLERVLVISAQEAGQAASHEQTAEEVKKIDQNTSTRVVFTGTSVDCAIDYWKKQLYDGLMAYGEDEFYAQVPMEQPLTGEELEALGFSYAEDDAAKSYDTKTRKAKIKATKSAIAYETFASDRDGQDRPNTPEMARNMIEFVKLFVSDPEVKATLGVEQIIRMANYIGRMAGFPRDFKLQVANPNAVPTQDALAQMQQYIEQVKQEMTNDVQGALQEVVQQNSQEEQVSQQLAERIGEIQAILAQIQSPQPPAPGRYDDEMPQVPGGMMAGMR